MSPLSPEVLKIDRPVEHFSSPNSSKIQIDAATSPKSVKSKGAKHEQKFDLLLTPPGVTSGVLSLNLNQINTKTVTNEMSQENTLSPKDTSGIVSDMLRTMLK